MTLHCGTSSWSEATWAGVFYPPGTRPGEQLIHYATQFRSVEADVTYYRVPDQRLVEGWLRKTPEHFRLSAKFPRTIVHGGQEATPDPAHVLALDDQGRADLAQFLEMMALLGKRCGPLVLQFPFFNSELFAEPGKFLERLDPFLAGLPGTFRYGVEVRNESWIGEPLLEVLRRHRAALVLVDLAYMPHPATLAKRFDLITTDFVYARLIGDRKGIEALTDRFDRVVVDQTDRLRRWAKLLAVYMRRVPETYLYANNHYAGFAPETIRTLVGMIEEETRG